MEGVLFTGRISEELKKLLSGYRKEMVFFVTDSNAVKYCMPFLDWEADEEHLYVLPEGESSKTLDEVGKVWKMLIRGKARRDSVVVNVGGGVVTDLGGFAASCYKRGMKCINIPTTLLSQVDASVGGKTGVNFCGLKNEIGTFSIPSKVLIDNQFLKTLPREQVISGYAEMLKHAMLIGENELKLLMKTGPDRVYSPEFLPFLKRSVQFKEKIVTSDPREMGMRKCLNLGHTAGHAIESAALARKEVWYHGYSVAYGLIVAMYLSVEEFGFDSGIYRDVSAFIRNIYPPLPQHLDGEELYSLMLHDKKNDGNGVNFTLLKAPGNFIVNCHCRKENILSALRNLEL